MKPHTVQESCLTRKLAHRSNDPRRPSNRHVASAIIQRTHLASLLRWGLLLFAYIPRGRIFIGPAITRARLCHGTTRGPVTIFLAIGLRSRRRPQEGKHHKKKRSDRHHFGNTIHDKSPARRTPSVRCNLPKNATVGSKTEQSGTQRPICFLFTTYGRGLAQRVAEESSFFQTCRA